jgi:hypothetical protein
VIGSGPTTVLMVLGAFGPFASGRFASMLGGLLFLRMQRSCCPDNLRRAFHHQKWIGRAHGAGRISRGLKFR